MRSGERVENADLIKVQSFKIKTKFPQRFLQISKLFTDQLTLDNLPRPQLVRLLRITPAHIMSPVVAFFSRRFASLNAQVLMCRLLNISDWGTDGILRMQVATPPCELSGS